jgi:hypothetical protein
MNRFLLATGRVLQAPGARLLVVSTHDGSVLGEVVIDERGRFELAFAHDPRGGWAKRGVGAICFVAHMAEGPRLLHGSHQRGWRLDELPVDVTLAVAASSSPPVLGSGPILIDQDTINVEIFNLTTSSPGVAGKPGLALGTRGPLVEQLHASLATLGFAVPERERHERTFGVGTRDALRAFQASVNLPVTGGLEDMTRDALAAAAAAQPAGRHIEGRLVGETGLPAAGVPVRLVHRGFGGQVTALGHTTTDAQGYYALGYDAGAGPSHLELRTVDSAGKEVPLAEPRFAAGRLEVVDAVVSADVHPPAAEYRLLASLVAPHLAGASLALAREDTERRDVTMLHRTTGWDARLVAMAALAARHAPELEVSAEALYGLYRAGLPTEPRALSSVSREDVEAALHAARTAGIVDLSPEKIERTGAALESFASAAFARTHAGLLAIAGLSEREQATFLALHRTTDGEALWAQVAAAGIAPDKVERLRVQGTLATLTLGVPALIASLAEGLHTRRQIGAFLVDSYLHTAEAWRARLGDVPVPRGDAGAFSEELARRVRLAYPTHVLSQRIVADEISLGARHEELRAPVRQFLLRAADLGLVLGSQPVDELVRTHHAALFDEGSDEVAIADTITAVKRLHRLVQTTPSDHALGVLSKQGFDSAHEISRYAKQEFLLRFGALFKDVEEAAVVHDKARQVTSTLYTMVTAARQLDSLPTVFALSAPPDEKEQAKAQLIKRFPTMETLFGSLDFCACEHCRSVLSPAAYLVDLFQFIDPDDKEWASFKTQWKTTHGADYPHPRPFDVLAKRRPDLENLALTCENTNTVLPYIDVVNEILEHAVAQNGLSGLDHDTGDARTAELVAEPQHILPRAYEILRDEARYPIGLPFDRPLETVRRFLAHFDVPFAGVLELFRTADTLAARAEVWREELGLSPKEHALFVDPAVHTAWHTLFGYASASAAFAALPSAKELAHRLGVAYEELVDLVRTGFVNPRLDTLVTLHKLRIDATHAIAYKEGKLSSEESTAFAALLVKEGAATWLDDVWSRGDLAKVLVLADPAAGCDFARTTLRHGNGDAATDLDFLRLNLFVRLRRRLGWSIEELDRALQVFLPAGDLAAGFATALVYLAHLTAIERQLALGRNARVRLLSLWAPIATTGRDPLYAQLFLVPSVLKDDRELDSRTGAYLTTGKALVDHLRPIQAALQITVEDVERVLVAEGQKLATAKLDLATVSLLYRHGLLARGLKISIADLLTLKTLTGLDPFKKLVATPITKLEDDHPFVHTLAFLRAAAAIKLSGFSVADFAAFLTPAARTASPDLTEALAGGITKVQAEHPVPAGDDLTDDVLRGELATVLPPEVVEPFLEQLRGGVEHEVSRTGIAAGDAVDPRLLAGQAGLRTTYDEARRTQHLAYRGVLTDERKAVIKTRSSSSVLAGLLDDVQAHARRRFARALADILERLTATTLFVAVQPGITVSASLDPTRLAAEPTLRVRHDAATQVQRLSCRGLLSDADRNRLAVVGPLLGTLLQDVQAQGRAVTDPLVRAAVGLLAATITHAASEPGVAVDTAPFSGEAGLRLEHDGGVQTVTYTGTLSDTERQRLKALAPGSTVLATLLDRVAAAGKTFLTGLRVETLAATDFTAPFADLAALAEPVAKHRVRLAQAILPFLQRKLVRDEVSRTLTAGATADPPLVEALITDPDLLSEPSAPGVPLLEAFASASTAGASVSYLDGTGTSLGSAVVPGITTAGKPAGTTGARFSAFLRAPRTGAYRFFLVLDKLGAEAELHIGTQVDPLIRTKAVRDRQPGDEGVSQFVELREGTPVALTLEVRGLGGGDVELLVQADDLPRGSLARLSLRPQTVIDRVDAAHALLDAVLRLSGVLGLGEGDLRHLISHPRDFDGFDPGALRFAPLLRVLDYARLRRALPAGELVEVLSGARRRLPPGSDQLKATDALMAQLIARVSALTGAEPKLVEAVAKALGLAAIAVATTEELRVEAAGFTTEVGVARLWRGIEMVTRLGVPAEALARWATPVPGELIAQDVRAAVKARFSQEAWLGIAASIFDPLRRLQRDALVAQILHRDGFDRVEQLFDHYLVDPGMEPVVRTSRLRLAISSVQTFIQRCLLNLESQVDPSTISSSRWQWMKRYRVWEANRKIFLWPENWLEPELRDDKTHLFQALEGALLQGDVTDELAEDAFFNYLSGLEEIARLEVMSTYLETRTYPDSGNILHVVARTFSVPHRYFYRRLEEGSWSPWEPVTTDIEGDHVAIAVWRKRVHLFWVTFAVTGKEPDKSKVLSQMSGTRINESTEKQVDAQLSWSAYHDSQWGARVSSGFGVVAKSAVTKIDFFPGREVLHVSVDAEDHLSVHLSAGDLAQSFYLVSRHAAPGGQSADAAQELPYTPTQRDATWALGSEKLLVSWMDRRLNGVLIEETPRHEAILHQTHLYSLVPCDNPLSVASAAGGDELGPLLGPFFYQDERNTFFVVPTLKEDVSEGGWVNRPPSVRWKKDLAVKPRYPLRMRERPERDDWLGGETIHFDGVRIGATGRDSQ